VGCYSMKMERSCLRNGQFVLTTRSSTNSPVNSPINYDIRMLILFIIQRSEIMEQKVATFFLTEIDLLDVWFPGRKRQPDAALVPVPRPNPNILHAAIVKTQPILGFPFPTVILEVGNTQSCPDILGIRDRALSYLTGINVFVTVVYNRNQSRASDSWYMEVAVRDYLAPQPPPGTQNTYPPCLVLFETAKVNGRYPLVNTRISSANNNNIWPLPSHHFYHPQPVPILNPPLPAQFHINIEAIRSCIETERLP
jgi:hypothetical protein